MHLDINFVTSTQQADRNAFSIATPFINLMRVETIDGRIKFTNRWFTKNSNFSKSEKRSLYAVRKHAGLITDVNNPKICDVPELKYKHVAYRP